MDLSSLTNHTKVVILDNNEDEGNAIREVLNQNGVASHFHYFKDKTEITKLKAFPNARLIFLDLELDTNSRDIKIKANTTLTCLQRLVEPNSYYVLVVWSGELNTELSRRFLKILKEQGKDFYPCITPILLNKKHYHDGTKFDYKKLRKDIIEKLKAVDFFNLFSAWEYQIDAMASKFLKDLLGINETAETVSRKINSLAVAYNGKYASDNPSLYALLTLNSAFKGTLDSSVVQDIDFKDSNSKLQKNIYVDDPNEKARINGLLMLNEDGLLGPGNVFKVGKTSPTASLNKGICGTTRLTSLRGAARVKVDITPICDHAQDKAEYNRYVHGYLVPHSVTKRAIKRGSNPEGRLGKQLPYAYELTNVFLFEGKHWELIVDLRAIETIPTHDRKSLPKKGDIWLRFKDGIVIDLQHRVSSHASRPGHSLID